MTKLKGIFNWFTFIKVKYSIFIILTLLCVDTFGQCVANAGNDSTICVSNGLDSIYLGGLPTVTSGSPPYTYTWSGNYTFWGYQTASFYLDDTTSANPRLLAFTDDTLALFLTVTDNVGNKCNDTVILKFCGNFILNLDEKFRHIQQGDTTQLHTSIRWGCEPLSFQWFPTHNISDPYSANPFVWPDTTTFYYILVTDSAGCQARRDDFPVYVYYLNVNAPNIPSEKLKIFPNPLTDKSTITTSFQNINLVFYDVLGRNIFELKVNESAEIERANFHSTGIYYYVAFDDNRILEQGKLAVY